MPYLYLLLALLCGGALGAQTTVTYSPSTADFANPERGYYRYSQSAENGSYAPLDAAEMASWRDAHSPASDASYTIHSTLVFRYFVLGDFVNGPISAAYLASVQADFDAVRTAGVKLIPRFAYVIEANTGSCGSFICPPYGDASKAIVLQHIAQLAPVLQANGDVIAAVQLGFIGTWGEQYYTDHFGDASLAPFKLTNANWNDRNEVLGALLDAVPDNRFVQVRYPQLKQRYVYGVNAPTTSAALTAAEAYTGTDKARTGHHNDCLLASADDFGTYFDYGNDSSGATSALATLKPYTRADGQYAPVGGETCSDGYSPQNDCDGTDPLATAYTELQRLHYSYLNSQYNNDVNNDWVSGGCMADIKRNLGYRLALTAGTYTDAAQPGQAITVDLALTNQGFAAPYNPRAVRLLLRNTTGGTLWGLTTADDPRRWLPGIHSISGDYCLPANVPTGDYELLLHLADPAPALTDRPAYAIRLANAGTWEASTGYHLLGHTLQVSGGAAQPACAGQATFALLSGALPVSLTGFTASASEQTVRLTWSTQTETNHAGFGVERRTDDTDFTVVAFVDSPGDSNSLRTYQYTDADVTPETTYYYRLALTDIDGTYTYSPTVSAALPVSTRAATWPARLRWVPNPATQRVRPRGDAAPQRTRLLDVHGRTVRAWAPFAGAVELRGIEPGLYLLEAERNGQRAVRRLLVE